MALSILLTEAEIQRLNPRGVNCLRRSGNNVVIWGSRTLLGDDALGSEWKYVPVRRTALFIEESLDRGLRWTASEANNETLWAEIRESAAAFLHGLFRAGAFQGQTPREAFFVKCDRGMMTQGDIASGSVKLLIGFAPLKPAEFVLLTLTAVALPAV